MKILYKALWLSVCALMCFSCTKEQEVIVPDVFVDFTINIQMYNELQAINNAVIIPNEGYGRNGVIIYRLNLEEFLAFDATCPQHIGNSTGTKIDDSDPGYATCPHCGTTYSFMNFGQASEGHPLKRYKVHVSGYLLRVYL